MRIMHALDRFEEVFSALCLSAMVFLIGMQVFYRYVLEDSLVWSEELSRYLFIWAVYIGCSFAAKENRHLEVTFIRVFLGPRLKRVAISFSYFMSLVFCGFCVVWGIQMLEFLNRTGQQTLALEISIYWVYLSLPVGMALMGLRMAQGFWKVAIKGELPPGDMVPDEY